MPSLEQEEMASFAAGPVKTDLKCRPDFSKANATIRISEKMILRAGDAWGQQ